MKTCVKYFLKMEKVDLELMQDLIYIHAVPVLNNSIFYTDASLDADSKFYSVVAAFFVNSLEKMVQKQHKELQNSHISKYLNLIINWMGKYILLLILIWMRIYIIYGLATFHTNLNEI